MTTHRFRRFSPGIYMRDDDKYGIFRARDGWHLVGGPERLRYFRTLREAKAAGTLPQTTASVVG